jgi:hypothetical protein
MAGDMAFYNEGIVNVGYSPSEHTFLVKIKYYGFAYDGYTSYVHDIPDVEFDAAQRCLALAKQHHESTYKAWAEQIPQTGQKSANSEKLWLLDPAQEAAMQQFPGWATPPTQEVASYMAALHQVHVPH